MQLSYNGRSIKNTLMKQCPACKTTYTDETLRFCLVDGNTLDDLGGEQTTVLRPDVAQMRVDISQPAALPGNTRTTSAQNGSSGGLFKVLLVLIGLGILGVLLVAVGGFIYFNASRSDAGANKDVRAATSPTPAAKDDKDELRDQIANLEKRLNEQKKTGQPANVPMPMPNQSKTTTSARVNSPSDGFLALRSLPSSEAGDRIAKIPHGATVSIGGCGPVISTARRSGRWCQASYNGYSGWVYDAYLIY